MKRISQIIFILTVFISIIFYLQHGKHAYSFYGDSLGYYSYLPATFCLQNLDSIDKLPTNLDIEKPVFDYFEQYRTYDVRSPKGYYVNQYTCGVALYQLPFFIIAHTYEKIIGKISSGYSSVFHLCLQIGSLFYVFLGLLFLYKILNHLLDSAFALMGISIVLLGSNLFWFTFLQYGMAHSLLFFLYSALIWLTIRTHKNPSTFNFILSGLVLGSIFLTRPTDIVAVFFPLLYNVYNRETFNAKIKFLKKHWVKILWLTLCVIIPCIPQFIYWKVYTGSFIYYSYNEQGFDFVHPKIWLGLFGPENGWLLYSPLWILSFVGLLVYSQTKKFIWSILIILPIYVYIVYSWYCYMYINGFGSRPMVHLYPLLSIPLVALLYFVAQQKRIALKVITFLFIAFSIYVNLHFTVINRKSKYWSESSNWSYFRHMLFKSNLSYNDLVFKDIEVKQPNPSSLFFKKTLGYTHFIKHSSLEKIKLPPYPDSVFYIPKGIESPDLGLDIKMDTVDYNAESFLKVICALQLPNYLADPHGGIKLTTSFFDMGNDAPWFGLDLQSKIGLPKDRNYAHDSITIHRAAPGIWDTISYFVPLKDIESKAKARILFWNISKETFYVDYLKVELYNTK